IDFTFSETINAGTLGLADLALTRNGGANLLTGAEALAFVAGTTYRISGLTALTGTDGNYAFKVDMTGIQDLATNSGVGTKTRTWSKGLTSTRVLSTRDINTRRQSTV